MGRKPIVITAVLALGAIGGATALHATQSDGDGNHWGWGARDGGHFEKSRMGRSGRHGHRGPMAMMSKLCGPNREERVEDVLNLVESFVQMDDSQKAAWAALATEVRASNEPIDQACASMKSKPKALTLPARVSRMETMLGTGYELISRLRPKFEAFYATLSDDQRSALERMTKRHRHGWRERRSNRS